MGAFKSTCEQMNKITDFVWYHLPNWTHLVECTFPFPFAQVHHGREISLVDHTMLPEYKFVNQTCNLPLGKAFQCILEQSNDPEMEVCHHFLSKKS